MKADQALSVRGLDAAVDVFRDSLGIPHVRATTTADAFFGQGFVHAQDRWWQMCFDRRRAEGRLAEWLGPPRLKMDVFARRTDLANSARRDYESFDAATRDVLSAFAAGVNAWLATQYVPPREFELLGIDGEPEWNAWDCGSVFKARHVLMGSYGRKLWRAQLIKRLGLDAAVAVGTADRRDDLLITGGDEQWLAHLEDAEPSALATAGLADGSNNWAVHGSRTVSAMPLVAGDPHRALEAPNVYYQNHIACDAFDAIGFSMAGVPGIFHFGHNAHVAWAVTHAMADQQDLFAERFDGDGRYEFRSEWRTPETRTETIRVRGADDVTVDVTKTHHGPVVFGDPAQGTATAIRWTSLDRPDTTLGCLLPMLCATTVAELDESMRGWVDPCNNFVMADREGTIAYLQRGRVPVRPRANGWAPVPGWTGDHEWDGDVPFEELPRVRNPDAGFIVTANNRVARNDYPYYLGMDYAARYRAQGVVDRVEALAAATASDMGAVHADRVSIPGRLFADAVNQVVEWDGEMQHDSAGAALYAVTREELAALLCEREPLSNLGPGLFGEDPLPSPVVYRVRVALPRLIELDDRTITDGASWPELIAIARDRAVAKLGEQPWRWDAIHTTHTRHPVSRVLPEASDELDPPVVSSGGDGECVNCTGWENAFFIEHGSVARYVFDLADWERSGWVVPGGASGDPRSTHYADQLEPWSRVELFPMTYAWDRVEAGASSAQRLEPDR